MNPEQDALANEVRGLAEAYVSAVLRTAQSPVCLDYTRLSLRDVDEWLDHARSWTDNEEELKKPNSKRGLIFLSCGFYVGETIIRNLGGIWVDPRKAVEGHEASNPILPPAVIKANLKPIDGEVPRAYINPTHHIFRLLSDPDELSSVHYFDKLTKMMKS